MDSCNKCNRDLSGANCSGCHRSPADCDCKPRVRPVASPCGGCGTMLRPYPCEPEHRHLPRGAQIQLAPGVEVYVCEGRREGDFKKACADKARLARGLCPGCGEDMGGHTLLRRGLCVDCLDALDRMRKLTDKPVAWYALDRHGLFGYLSREDDANPLALRVVQLLAQALAVAGRRYQATGDHFSARCLPAQRSRDHWFGDAPLVELDADQLPLIEELAGLIYQVTEAERRGGVGEGSSLLHQLATGARTPDDFADLQAKHTQPVPDFDRRCHLCSARSLHGLVEHEKSIRQHLERLVPRQPAPDDEAP